MRARPTRREHSNPSRNSETEASQLALEASRKPLLQKYMPGIMQAVP